MGRHPDRHRHETQLAIATRNVTEAVGRIGQTVQQDHRSGRRPIGLENIGVVEVVREVAGIDRATRVEAVAQRMVLGIDLVDDLAAHVAEDCLFGSDVGRPVHLVDLGSV